MFKAWNQTIISLIPKVQNPTNLKNYRPISLCNVAYKVISKILIIGLRKVLKFCINKNQADSIPGKEILDNVIISHEYLHFMKNKKARKRWFYAMFKAYDRVEGKFLDSMIDKMGFCAIWRK